MSGEWYGEIVAFSRLLVNGKRAPTGRWLSLIFERCYASNWIWKNWKIPQGENFSMAIRIDALHLSKGSMLPLSTVWSNLWTLQAVTIFKSNQTVIGLDRCFEQAQSCSFNSYDDMQVQRLDNGIAWHARRNKQRSTSRFIQRFMQQNHLKCENFALSRINCDLPVTLGTKSFHLVVAK